VRSATVAPIPEGHEAVRATLPFAFQEVAGATADTVFAVGESGEGLPVDADGLVRNPFGRDSKVLAALSLRPLAARWSRGFPGHAPASFGLLGDDLVKAEGGAVEVLDGATGDVARRITLPASASDLVVEGGRALVSLFAERPALVALDLAEGNALWDDSGGGTGSVAAGLSVVGGRVWCTYRPSHPIRLLDLETGAEIARPFELGPGEVGAGILASDERGVVLSLHATPFSPSNGILEERELESGLRRWRLVGLPLRPRTVALGASTALVLGIESALMAIDRETGKLLWRHPVDESAAPSGIQPAHALAVAGEVAYLGRADPDGVSLRVLEVSSGKTVLERRFLVAVDSQPVGFDRQWMAVRAFDLVPVPSGVLLLVASEGKTAAILLEGPRQQAASLPGQ
jgi:hypothetical protein